MIIIKFCRIGAMNKKNGIKLFIGGISPETTADTLRSYFQIFAMVVHSKVEIGKKLKLPKGYGYVTVPDIRSVKKIISQEHYIDGKKVDVEIARGKTKGGKPAEDLAGLMKKEESLISTFPTNETVKASRKIEGLQGHMNKYFHQQVIINHHDGHSKQYQLPLAQSSNNRPRDLPFPQVISAIAMNTDSGISKIERNLHDRPQQQNQQSYLSNTNNFDFSSQACFGQHRSLRSYCRVSKALRYLNHSEINTRFNPTGSFFSRVRGRM